MHHAVGQFAVGGQQQQAGGIEVEAPDRDPAAVASRGRRSKTVLRPSGSLRVVTSPSGLW
jgi:hypothetical protein